MFLQKKKENGPNDTNYIYKDANSSKARENTQTVDYRQRFNDTYSTIIGGTDKTTGNTGYSQDNNGNVSNVLKYDSYYNDEYKSELVQNTKYSVESANNYVNIYGSTGVGVSIISTTKNAECNLKDMYEQLPEGAREIENVNLGIYEREQPDLAIVTDIDNIKLSINGYEHTYNYKQRADFVSEGIPDQDLNAGYRAAMDGFSVHVKNDITGKYKNLTYNRSVYDSYIAYTKSNKENNPNTEDVLRMFVTYRIAVKNESGGLISKVSLRNYADARYESISESYVYDKNKSDGHGDSVNWESKKQQDANTNMWKTGIIEKEIAPGECMYVYLKYEVSTATIVEMATLNPNGNEGNKEPNIKIGTNVTEINAYQTYKKLEDGQNHTYAGIDKDSAPNNIKCGNIVTYEDDTDAAPDLYLTRKASKQFSGLVFEDATDNKLKTGSERLGNGVYDENEDPAVKNVEVKLVKYNSNSGLVTNNNDVITLYTLDGNGNVVTRNAQTITGDGGTYNFTGFIPGEYYIVYTYGKYKYIDMNKENTSSDVQSEAQRKVQGKAITTQEYKSTIIDEGTYRILIDNNYNIIKDNNLWYWYENSGNSGKSSAVDDNDIRTKINEYLSAITYGNKTAYEGESYNDNNGNNVTNANHQLMKSYTGIMDVAIEDSRDQTTEYEKSGVSDEEKRNYQIKYGYDTNSGGNGETSDEVKRNYQIKFGIVERPRQSLKVTKDIASVKLALANGQIIAEGNKEDIQAGRVKYIVYPDGGFLKIEIDNEIIEGADLDINYRINVQNLSEIDYNDLDYYRYGFVKDKNKESSLVKLTPAIADYVDEKLSVTYDIDKNNRTFKYYDATNDTKNIWQLLPTSGKEDKKLAGIDISQSVFKSIKNRSNIVVKKTDDKILPKVTENTPNDKDYNLLAKKKLTSISTNTDNTFENYVELIEVYNSVGRFYGVDSDREHPDNNIWKYETPGNFDVTNKDNLTESDTNFETDPSKVTIMPPTGDNKIYYYIIGISSLVILVGGIIIIKKKVL